MQSFDSACQEADLIINDTISKLKGSGNVLRERPKQTDLRAYHQHDHQYLVLQSPQSTQSLLNANILQISSQPPAYIFDGVDSLPDDLLASVKSSTTVGILAGNELASPILVSNINSITSPSPVVPDTLFSTPPLCSYASTSLALPSTLSQMHYNATPKVEKRSLYQQSLQVSDSNQNATTTSAMSTPAMFSTTSSSNSSSRKTTSSFFDIHGKIRELYLDLLYSDVSSLDENRKKHRTRSFVLERLVDQEKLNTIVVNLYPGNKGYSLSIYHDSRHNEHTNNNYSGYRSNNLNSTVNAGTSSSRHKQRQQLNSNSNVNLSLDQDVLLNYTDDCGMLPDNDDSDDDQSLIEIMRWPYEVDEMLSCIDSEILPSFISDILETRIPYVFYSGCVICQVRDFRQTFSISSNSCDNYHVLLKPTNDNIYSDVHQLTNDADIHSDDKLFVESQMILATADPLCLEPDPEIGRYAINSQFKRQMYNTNHIRRQMKKYSQTSINRKLKIDQFTHNDGLDLCDYLQRMREVPRPTGTDHRGSNGRTLMSSFSSKLTKKPQGILKSIRVPNLDYPPLTVPEENNVEKFAIAYERPKESRDCINRPQNLMEQKTTTTIESTKSSNDAVILSLLNDPELQRKQNDGIPNLLNNPLRFQYVRNELRYFRA